ncbi:MAG: LiaF transmembrane domain-containing protein [Flavobacteriaceae bacterium]|nr:cell wall-active antibiotics response protein [Psychroflexus sp.]
MANKEEFKTKTDVNVEKEDWQKHRRLSKITIGILVIATGILVLLRQTGIYIPHWLLSWRMLLVAAGFVILIKHNFKNTAGYIMMFLGLVFILKTSGFVWINSDFLWPIVIIGVGILILAKNTILDSKNKYSSNTSFKDLDADDFVSAETFFGGVTKKVVSKNFKGGSLTHVFGGSKINLMRVDFKDKAVIDITCVFGGSTLTLPADWKVKSDVTTIFGGFEDKRATVLADTAEEPKVLILKGICVFGGIEINNYD